MISGVWNPLERHGGGLPVQDQIETMEDERPLPQSPDLLFSRLPPWVIDSLTTEQKEAIHTAATDPTWDTHPVNIRFSVPLFGRRFYLTIVGGEEKRTSERRARERHRYPLRTVANVFFFIGLATIFYVVAIAGLAVQSAIVEF